MCLLYTSVNYAQPSEEAIKTTWNGRSQCSSQCVLPVWANAKLKEHATMQAKVVCELPCPPEDGPWFRMEL